MIEVVHELLEGLLEIDVVLPERIVGVDEQIRCHANIIAFR